MKNSKIKRIFLSIVAVIMVIIAALMVAAGIFVYRVRFSPPGLGKDTQSRTALSGDDLVTFAKYLTDRQVVENLKNFEKESAKEILTAMIEIDEENMQNPELQAEIQAEAQAESPAPAAPRQEVWDEKLTEPIKNIHIVEPEPVPEPEPVIAPEDIIEESGIEVSEKEKSAYQRIMEAASKDEISAGMSILSKVDLAKVNKLRKEGKNSELKKYIKSVLTSSEISKSLSLYKKYKHLL